MYKYFATYFTELEIVDNTPTDDDYRFFTDPTGMKTYIYETIGDENVKVFNSMWNQTSS